MYSQNNSFSSKTTKKQQDLIGSEKQFIIGISFEHQDGALSIETSILDQKGEKQRENQKIGKLASGTFTSGVNEIDHLEYVQEYTPKMLEKIDKEIKEINSEKVKGISVSLGPTQYNESQNYLI